MERETEGGGNVCIYVCVCLYLCVCMCTCVYVNIYGKLEVNIVHFPKSLSLLIFKTGFLSKADWPVSHREQPTPPLQYWNYKYVIVCSSIFFWGGVMLSVKLRSSR